MAYQVLARKWRPQDFSSLVGQEPIVTALRNALAEGRIAQAYLFSGIRGVGKTTAARVFAKALNCERGPGPDPCNECTACREITVGADLDVIEVDAATYSKVEQVRDLTESLRYGPTRDRYKVVVLDEVHRLSRAAFDALLKIVEEPPPHLVFLFATTELEAVPATILSRCQEFHFRRVGADKLAAHLAAIATSEQIGVSETALRMIARAAEGSVRDAVALLDQMATFGSGRVADEDAARLLGGLDTALFETVMAAIFAADHAAIVAAVGQIEDDGFDPRSAFAHFLAYCRDALHLALGGDPARVDLPGEEATRLAGRAKEIGYENLLRLVHQLLGSEAVVRRSDSPAVALEIAWLRAAELPRLTRIEDFLSRGEAGAVPAAPRHHEPPPRPAPLSVTAPPPRAPAPPPPRVEAPAVSHPHLDARFFDEVNRRKPPLAAYLRHAQDVTFEQGVLRIAVPRGDDALQKRLDRDNNRQILEEAIAAVWGAGHRWELVEGVAPVNPPTASSPVAATALGPSSEAARPQPETVQTVLEIFGGAVESVEPNEETPS